MACTFPSCANTVDEWLNALNLARYAPQLAAAGLQVSQLPTITDEQLSAAGVAILGHRKRMLQASKELVVAAPAPPPAPAPAPPPRIDNIDIGDAPAMGPGPEMMDTDSPEWPQRPPMPGSSALGAGTSSANGNRPRTPPPAQASSMDTSSSNGNGGGRNGIAKAQPQQKANSTSSIYITSTLVKPDTDEVVFCIAAVIHDRIQQGEVGSADERHRFPFFSEDNNPLYAPPAERDGRGDDSSGSDSSMKRTRREVPTEDMIFHTIRSVYECARIPAECLIVSLVYIERLIAISGCPMLVTSWRPILLSALILAQKVWDDRSLHNIDFSVFCPMFTLKEINFLEKKFLELIDYDVSISASLYASYYFQLRTLCQRVDREFSLKPMDIDTAAKLEARGVAYKEKFKSDHGAVRKHQSDNNIGQGAPGTQSNFISKLFG